MFRLTEPVLGDHCLNYFGLSKPNRRGQHVLWDKHTRAATARWGSENCLTSSSSTWNRVIPMMKRCHRMRSGSLIHLICMQGFSCSYFIQKSPWFISQEQPWFFAYKLFRMAKNYRNRTEWNGIDCFAWKGPTVIIQTNYLTNTGLTNLKHVI